MYFVGDEFAFDFVPEDREAPVFMNEDEEDSNVDIALNLEEEMKRGK